MNFNSGKRVKQCPVSELNASHRYANDGTIMKAVYHQKKPWIEPRCNVYVQLVHSNQPLDINKDPTACGVSQCIPQSLAIENIIRWVIKKISGFGFCRLYWTFVLSREGNCPSLFKLRALEEFSKTWWAKWIYIDWILNAVCVKQLDLNIECAKNAIVFKRFRSVPINFF